MMNEKKILALQKYIRLTNYLSAAQIFLKKNIFLERKLEVEDIKERLLGHWGTCPGINYVYAHVNRLIQEYKERDFLFTVGTGHGFPAYQSNILLEGSLSYFFPHLVPYTKKGFEYVVSHFSVPYGFPSHLNPEAPGVLLEGGELGYSLSVAAGTILDNKKLINICLIGDGEAETATLSASWKINTFLSPKTDGAVLPILHLNGYKISGPTIFGRMSDEEIDSYFFSLGWKVYFLQIENFESIAQEKGIRVFDRAIKDILSIQKKWKDDEFPRWPLIILKSPKGLTGPKELLGKKIEGNCDSHQVIFSNPRENEEERKILESWLRSYHIEELIHFDKQGSVLLDEDILSLIPDQKRKIGMSPYAHGKNTKLPKIPDFNEIYTEQELIKEEGENSMYEIGLYFKKLIEEGNNFRLFSPDETYSNKLHRIFDVTKRVWMRKIEQWDRDFGKEGKVIEILSENVLFGLLWGYTLTGRYGYFATYESFGQIIASMADQYVKFIKIARKVPFRDPVPSLNIILSSLLERQDHNGFSHQNPSLIAENLDRDLDVVSVYLPADKNLAKLAIEKTMLSVNHLNIVVAGKKMKRIWLNRDDARKLADEGIGIFKWVSHEDPDIVIVSAGDYVTEEVIAGMHLLKRKMPHIKLRLVNVFHLNVFSGDFLFSKEEIVRRFLGKNTEILFHYHGYPSTIKKLLFDYNLSDRIIIKGYVEEGSTTSPFDMKARNELSRYHLVKNVAKLALKKGLIDEDGYLSIRKDMDKKLADEKLYIIKHFVDPKSIREW